MPSRHFNIISDSTISCLINILRLTKFLMRPKNHFYLYTSTASRYNLNFSAHFQLLKEIIFKWTAHGERDRAIFQRTLERTIANMLQCVKSISARAHRRNYIGGRLQHQIVSQRKTGSIRGRAYAKSENCAIANAFWFDHCSIGRRENSTWWRSYLSRFTHRNEHKLAAAATG